MGEVPVVAKLGLGSENIRLFLTSRRLILAHVGKRGVGALAAMPLLGKLSTAVEDLLKAGKEASRKKRLKTSTPGEILAESKDNFYINYDDIVRVEVKETRANVRIMLLTRESKFEFLTLMAYEQATVLFRGLLGEKVTAG